MQVTIFAGNQFNTLVYALATRGESSAKRGRVSAASATAAASKFETVTEFCEFTPDKHDLGDGKPPLKGEMWFSVTDQQVFAVAGFWQATDEGNAFAMVTCDPNELVKPIHPKAMVTILKEEDFDTWLRGSQEEAIALQTLYNASAMTVRGPVFPTRNR